MIFRSAGFCLTFWVAVLASLEAPLAGSIQLPVPRATIHPGHEITGQNLVDRRFPERTTQQFAVISDRNQLVGMVARRTLLPGRPVPINAVSIQTLVERGQPGRLVFREQGLFIVMQVEVLQSGGIGDYVRVRNVDSDVVVTGKVQTDGTILAEN
ncbi:flagellar basal body P-ring formation chaperone FlgA [uncultured Roseibium sp.]|uniref:flagellar basal body P-ring formation chaperone FlgA n=1 Tax=uncultured Roseibium sp. TaxID=1936171 RepID=UPI0032168283